jgi:hypothetical protein
MPFVFAYLRIIYVFFRMIYLHFTDILTDNFYKKVKYYTSWYHARFSLKEVFYPSCQLKTIVVLYKII